MDKVRNGMGFQGEIEMDLANVEFRGIHQDGQGRVQVGSVSSLVNTRSKGNDHSDSSLQPSVHFKCGDYFD